MDEKKEPVINLMDPEVWKKAEEIQRESQRKDQPLLKLLRDCTRLSAKDYTVTINT